MKLRVTDILILGEHSLSFFNTLVYDIFREKYILSQAGVAF